jgi:hypothetical protein
MGWRGDTEKNHRVAVLARHSASARRRVTESLRLHDLYSPNPAAITKC